MVDLDIFSKNRNIYYDTGNKKNKAKLSHFKTK